MYVDDNKVLGLGYTVVEDKLCVIIAINFLNRLKNDVTGENLLQEKIRAQTSNPLTRMELLIQLAGLYDSPGLITPAKKKEAILVDRAFQEAKRESCSFKDSWHTTLSDGLRKDAFKISEEYI